MEAAGGCLTVAVLEKQLGERLGEVPVEGLWARPVSVSASGPRGKQGPCLPLCGAGCRSSQPPLPSSCLQPQPVAKLTGLFCLTRSSAVRHSRPSHRQLSCRVFRQRSIICLVALNKFSECLWILNRNLEEDMRNPDLYVLCASFYERFGQDIRQALEL